MIILKPLMISCASPPDFSSSANCFFHVGQARTGVLVATVLAPRAHVHGGRDGLTVQEVTITNRRAESQHTASKGLDCLLVVPVVARSGLVGKGKTTRAGLAVGGAKEAQERLPGSPGTQSE